MSKLEYLSRHNLIIKKLRKVPSTFEQIHDYLERESEIQSYHFTVSKRTFQRDIEEILFMYNIEIKYDFSRKVYFISEEPQSDVNMRMLEAFDTFQAFKLSENIAEFICFEKRKPQGTQYLLNLLQAIKNQQVIILSHHKFEYQDSVERELEPLALKESRGRWYLVANVALENHIRTFGLDRVTDLLVLNKKFPTKSFDVNAYYKDCFGIIRPEDEEAQDVVLSFTKLQGRYVKNYPLHHSQKVISETEHETVISVHVFCTFDFVQELLSHRELLKIISPLSLLEEIQEVNKKIAENHPKNGPI